MNVKTRGYVAVVAACGVAALAVAAGNDQVRQPYMFGLLAIAAIATELLEVRVDVSALDGSGGHSFSFSSGIHLAAVMVLGPWEAALIAACGVLVVDYLRGSDLVRVLFNASSFALATLAAGAVYQAADTTPGVLALPADFGAIAAMAIVYVGVNRALISVIVSLTSKIPLRQLLRQVCTSDLGSTAGEISLGVTLAFFLLSNPWKVVALGPLVVAVYLAHARLTAAKKETARALETFANVVDERDPYTYRHSARVAEHVERLGEGLGLSPADVARLRWAGRLHDLGKIAVDTTVLRKSGRLDDREWEALRRHPRLSARLLLGFRFATVAVRAVEYHHERYDGRGYYGIAAAATPIGAQFLTVADSYDAMVTDRPYRRALSIEQALTEIENGIGTQFHPVPAKAFIALVRGEDPLAALDDAERALLRKLWRPRERARSGRIVLIRNLDQMLAIAGVAAVLVAATMGRPAFAALGAAAVAAGVLLARRRDGRARDLAEALDASLRDELATSPFSAFATPIARSAPASWIGLVRWHRDILAGSLEEEISFGGSAPSEDTLTSWLLRDGDDADGLVEGSTAELGGAGAYLAVPARRDGVVIGYVVVLFEDAVPRHVRLALAAAAPRLAHLLPEAGLRLATAGVAR